MKIFFVLKKILIRVWLALLICGISYQRLDLSNNHLELADNTYDQLIEYWDNIFTASSNSTNTPSDNNVTVTLPVDYDSILQRLQTPLYNDTMDDFTRKEKVTANFELHDSITGSTHSWTSSQWFGTSGNPHW